MTPIPVVLKEYEQAMGFVCGTRRFNESPNTSKSGKKHTVEVDISAACAEIAVAKKFNLYWDGSVHKYKKDGPDLKPDIEVRHTEYDNGRLILRTIDQQYASDYRHVLVVGHEPNFEIVGWIYGREGFRPEWERDKNEKWQSWWIPQNELWAMDTFLEIGE